MTIAAAESFIQQALLDPISIQKINAAPNKTAVEQVFAELGLSFNDEEFEQAYINLLTCCQTIEQAETVKEIKLWWDYFQYTLNQYEESTR